MGFLDGLLVSLEVFCFSCHWLIFAFMDFLAMVPKLFAHNMSSSPSSQTQVISKNIELQLCEGPVKERPLVVIFSWLMAPKKHLMKFADLYKQHGFDVLIVSITPFQLLWPAKGTQVVAEDVLKFLTRSDQRQRSLLVHGFSMGGYFYGEILLKMHKHPHEYSTVANRIVGQIFDSVVDYQLTEQGMPTAVTQNIILQKLMQMYLRFHLKVFYSAVMQHYIKSSNQFIDNCLVKSPALLFYSEDDPLGTPETHLRIIKSWENIGIKVHVKCFESSPHVSHLYYHAEQYLKELSTFLEHTGLLNAQFVNTTK